MNFNYQKLLGAIREKGFSQESLALQAHMSPASLSLKLNNKREFRQGEMYRILEALDIPINRLSDYFYVQKV